MSEHEHLRRGDPGSDADDEAIERRAIERFEAGDDWLTAITEATREIRAGAAGARPRSPTAGRRSISAGIGEPRRDRRLGLPGRTVTTAGLQGKAPMTADLQAATTVSASGVAATQAASRGQAATQAASRGDARIMRSAAPAAEASAPEAARKAAALTAGRPLPARLRRELERALGVDLAAVRLHTGGDADETARAIGAVAFAVGQDIGFRAGAYDPGRPDGVRLIAHEVAHTVQTRGARAPDEDAPAISQPDEAPERAADAFADTFAGQLGSRRADAGEAATSAADRAASDAADHAASDAADHAATDAADHAAPDAADHAAPDAEARLDDDALDDTARPATSSAHAHVGAARASVIHRQPAVGAPQPALPVTLSSFETSGTSLTGQALGYLELLTYRMNGVELRFALGTAEQRFRDLRPRQYGGPEAKWIRRGAPLNDQPFIALLRGAGPGWDDPEDASVSRRPAVIAYRDTPGPEIGALTIDPAGRPSRVHVVQNFTGWVEGTPISGGAVERISPVIGWFSIVSLFDENWENPGQPARYTRLPLTQAGQGWRPTDPPEI